MQNYYTFALRVCVSSPPSPVVPLGGNTLWSYGQSQPGRTCLSGASFTALCSGLRVRLLFPSPPLLCLSWWVMYVGAFWCGRVPLCNRPQLCIFVMTAWGKVPRPGPGVVVKRQARR